MIESKDRKTAQCVTVVLSNSFFYKMLCEWSKKNTRLISQTGTISCCSATTLSTSLTYLSTGVTGVVGVGTFHFREVAKASSGQSLCLS